MNTLSIAARAPVPPVSAIAAPGRPRPRSTATPRPAAPSPAGPVSARACPATPRAHALAVARVHAPRRAAPPRAAAGDAAGDATGGGESEGEEELKGIKGWWKKNSIDKAKLASLGTSVLLSYGFVSNVNAITLMLIAFVTFGKSQMVSPLAAGMWPKFLGVYAALYATFGNLLRPLRVALSISISPFFDKVVGFLQNRLKVKKPVAFGIVVFIVNVCGSFSYLIGGALLCSLVFGIPLIP